MNFCNLYPYLQQTFEKNLKFKQPQGTRTVLINEQDIEISNLNYPNDFKFQENQNKNNLNLEIEKYDLDYEKQYESYDKISQNKMDDYCKKLCNSSNIDYYGDYPNIGNIGKIKEKYQYGEDIEYYLTIYIHVCL